MEHRYSRTELLIGKEGIHRLSQAHVAVFGIGGVGGYVVEALARSGVGSLSLVDHDQVTLTNINRQIIATTDTIGREKTEVAKERIHSIDPDISVETHDCFYLPGTADSFDFSKYTYVVDAVDTVTAKLSIVEEAYRHHVPVISCMGAGNKLDPTRFQVADIYETSVCPLAKVMRQECRKRGIPSLKVVYSTEKPIHPELADGDNERSHTRTPGSISFVPSVAGLILAGEVIRDIIDSQT